MNYISEDGTNYFGECESCGVDIKVLRAHCKKNEHSIELYRNNVCLCGEVSNIMKFNVNSSIHKYINFDIESSYKKLIDGEILETKIGLVRWLDERLGAYKTVYLTLRNFEYETRSFLDSSSIKTKRTEEGKYVLNIDESTSHIQLSIKDSHGREVSRFWTNCNKSILGVDIEEEILNQFEICKAHFEVMNRYFEYKQNSSQDEFDIDSGYQSVINGGVLETYVGIVNWYDDDSRMYKIGNLTLRNLEAEIVLTHESSTTNIKVSENGFYVQKRKNEDSVYVEVYTSYDNLIHQFHINFNKNTIKDELITGHFEVMNRYFVSKQIDFTNSVEETFHTIIDNDDTCTLFSNFINKSEIQFWSKASIVVFERLLNRSKIGQLTLLCGDDESFHMLKYEHILDNFENDINLDPLVNYYDEHFCKLVKVIERRHLLLTEDLAKFVTWKLLRHFLIKYHYDQFNSENGMYFTEKAETIEEYVNICGSIDTVDFESVKNAGVFTYYLIYRGILETRNFLKAYDIVLEFLLICIENKKLDDFEKSLTKVESDSKVTYSINDIDLMLGHEFEHFVAQLFTKMGYSTKVTKGSGDQGVDVIAERHGRKFGIQAKCYASAITNKAIQEVAAGISHYRLDKGIVVTNNYFTESAKELAESNGVVLWDRNILKEKILEVF